MPENLMIAGREFHSRLIVGTGKYRSFQEMARCHAASGADMVTVAVRRVNLTDKSKESLLDYIDRSKFFILPNTAGCYTADEAIRTARLGREVGLSNWIKLEVIGDEKTLFPDNEGLLQATRVLVKEGFVVLPYTNDDVVNARKLIDAGAAAVMPLAAPIGSGLGVQNPANLRIMREMITSVPMIVDAGVGTASDAAIAMELGADAVLMNTAIAAAEDSVKMAEAMKLAVQAGRLAYEAGRKKKKINILDTPGFNIFINDTRAAMVAADSALVLVDGVAGVEVQTEKVWDIANSYNLPRAILINKLDRERSSFDRALESVQSFFGRTAIPVQLPLGAEREFKGVIDLVQMKAYTYSPDGDGKGKETEIPADLTEAAQKGHEALIEMVT